MKKFIILIIAATLLFSACQTPEQTDATDALTDAPDPTAVPTEAPTPEPTEEPTPTPEPTEPPITASAALDASLFDVPAKVNEGDEGFISVESLSAFNDQVIIDVKFSSNMDNGLVCYVNAVCLNHYSLTMWQKVDLGPHEEKILSVTVPFSEFRKYGIEKITDISFLYTLYRTDPHAMEGSHYFTISTSQPSEPIVPTGDHLIYTDEYIDVYYLGNGISGDYEYCDFLYYNKTSTALTVSNRLVAVNGISFPTQNLVHLFPYGTSITRSENFDQTGLSFFEYTDGMHSVAIGVEQTDMGGYTTLLNYGAQTEAYIIDESIDLVLPTLYDNIIFEENEITLSVGKLSTAIVDGEERVIIPIISANGNKNNNMNMYDITINGQQITSNNYYMVLENTMAVTNIVVDDGIELLDSNEVVMTFFLWTLSNTEKDPGDKTITFTVDK